MSETDLLFAPAHEIAARIRRKDVSAVEVMEAHLRQIERVNPQVNAIVTMDGDAAMEGARAADTALARGEAVGPLHGLPVGHKDLLPTKGMRTTWGSPLFAEHVPDTDALVVERLRAAGAITVGKTNTPEFGIGMQTFNAVFGATRNPYDPEKTCGGSSGGSAVAVACGMLPLADGGDLGGSIRNPASFNNGAGLRTSPGRVPVWPKVPAWFPLPVQGGQSRTVADQALLLQALAGPDDRAPISIREPASVFARPLERDFAGTRIAWSPDLGGLPLDPRVRAVLESARPVLGDLGCTVEAADPDMAGADESFLAWRAWLQVVLHGEKYEKHRDQLKPTLRETIEAGLKQTGPELGRAEAARTQLYHRLREFLQRYDYLCCTVNQVPPYPVSEETVWEVDGQRMERFSDWGRSCYWLTMTGLPCISVPAGFTDDGLPVGLQIVGRHEDDFGVLQLAHAFEQATGHWRRRPPVAA